MKKKIKKKEFKHIISQLIEENKRYRQQLNILLEGEEIEKIEELKAWYKFGKELEHNFWYGKPKTTNDDKEMAEGLATMAQTVLNSEKTRDNTDPTWKDGK